MTVENVIEELDKVLPNVSTTQQKVDWLNEIDKKIYRFEILTHEGHEEYTEPEYVVPGEGVEEQTLIVPSPFDALYLYFLMTKVYFFSGEFAKMNNISAVYNAAYLEFVNWYHANNMPISEQIILKVTDSDLTIEELNI